MAQVRINDDLHRKIKAFSTKRLGSIGEWVNKWILEGLRRDSKRTRRPKRIR